jgi:hypothetical protein
MAHEGPSREEQRHREHLNQLQQTTAQLNGVRRLLEGIHPNDVVYSGSAVITPAGSAGFTFRSTIRSFEIYNLALDNLTVASSTVQGTPPGPGQGTWIIPPNQHLTIPTVTSVLTVYGTPGDQFNLAAFSRLAFATTGPAR